MSNFTISESREPVKGSTSFNVHRNIYNEVIKDPMIHALLDRTGLKLNNEERFGHISECVSKTLKYFLSEKPDFIFFAAPPHHFSTWLFGKVALSMGIDVGFMSFTIFSNIHIFCMGMPGNCKPLKLPHNERTDRSFKKLVLRLTKVYERAQLSGDLAMPQAEAQLYGEDKKSVFRPFKSFLERPQAIRRIFYTWSLFRYFNKKLTECDIQREKYWIFFLHYQPERSTLPEGGEYFNHFEALLELRAFYRGRFHFGKRASFYVSSAS